MGQCSKERLFAMGECCVDNRYFYFCFTLAAYYFYISFYRTLWCFGPVNGNMQAIVFSCFALGLIYLYPRLGGENGIFNFSYSTIENLYIMSLIVQGIEHRH